MWNQGPSAAIRASRPTPSRPAGEAAEGRVTSRSPGAAAARADVAGARRPQTVEGVDELAGARERGVIGQDARRAARPIAASRSAGSASAWQTSSVVLGDQDRSPSRNSVSSPGQRSLMIGVPQAAASNSRTLGDQPAARMSARVTFSVKRWLA